jgi:hypothetical protein
MTRTQFADALSQRKKPPSDPPMFGRSDSGFAVFGGENAPALGFAPMDAHRRALAKNVSDSELFRKCKKISWRPLHGNGSKSLNYMTRCSG